MRWVPVTTYSTSSESSQTTVLLSFRVSPLVWAADSTSSTAEEVCRVLGLDPFGLLASGALLITLPAGEVPVLLAALEQENIDGWEIGQMLAPEEGLVLFGPQGEQPLPEFPRDELARYFSAK